MLDLADLRSACASLLFAVSAVFLNGAAGAADEITDQLFIDLLTASPEESLRIESQIVTRWSDSGSPQLNLLLQLGRRAMAARRLNLALRYLNILTRRAPEFAEGWNARATTYFLMGRYAQSRSDIAITLQLNPRHFGAMSGLAMIYEKLGDNQTALRIYQDVEALQPNRPGLTETMNRLRQKLAAKSV